MIRSIAELDLETALRPGTLEFATTNAPLLAKRLQPALNTFTREVRSLKGAPGLIVRRNFAQATSTWEKFFWAQVGEHHVRSGKSIDDALRLADEAVLGLSAALQPL